MTQRRWWLKSPPFFFLEAKTFEDIVGVENFEIARIFSEVADLLELKGENYFRIRAYRNAARSISNWPKSLSDQVDVGENLPKITGIGKDLEGKVKEICKNHTLKIYEELKKEFPKELVMLLDIPNLGPKRVRLLWDHFKIKNINQLKTLALNHEIQKLPRFGIKLEKKIVEDIENLHLEQKRTPLNVAEQVVESYVQYLKSKDRNLLIEPAGSFRRKLETVGDIDLLLVSDKKNNKIIDHFCNYDQVQKVISAGITRATVVLKSGIQVDLRLVPLKSQGSALIYFTGSKNHNIQIRKIAQSKGLKINEYGVFREDQCIAGKTEKEVYRSIGLEYIEPELRENEGEIEAASKGKLPHLIEMKDLRGDLHVHSNRSDGSLSLQEISKIAESKGYEYIALTDHSLRLKIAHGLTVKELRNELEEIDLLNDKNSKFKILKSAEIDILEDGSLDMSEELLKELDIVVCAVHSSFKLSSKKQTDRILKAIRNPFVHILAHPTGRLIQERSPYEVDIEQVIAEAKKQFCALEINSQPSRLDLNDHLIRIAKNEGVQFSISTDAHSIQEFEWMKFGIGQARRGWLEKKDAINTQTLNGLLLYLKNKK